LSQKAKTLSLAINLDMRKIKYSDIKTLATIIGDLAKAVVDLKLSLRENNIKSPDVQVLASAIKKLDQLINLEMDLSEKFNQ